MSTSSVQSLESGGEKRKSEFTGEDNQNIDFDDNKSDDDEVEKVNVNGLIDRVPKNVTAMYQVILLFEYYDESKPKVAETTNVMVNISMAGDRVKTGALVI